MKYAVFAKVKQRLEKLVKYVIFAKAKQRLEKVVKYPFGHQKAPTGLTSGSLSTHDEPCGRA